MSGAPNATRVLDGFLAARAATAPAPKLARTREVINAFHTYVEAHDPAPLDDLTAHRLIRATPLEPTERELSAVLAVIEHVTGFFRSLEGDTDVPTTAHPAVSEAGEIVGELADWLVERRLVDDEVAEHLSRYTRLYVDTGQRTGS